VVGDNPFAVLLPDVLVDEASCDLRRDNLAKMVSLFDETQVGQIMVEGVNHDLVDQYGIADVNGHDLKSGESKPLIALVEKPSIDEAPSNLAVVGRYVLPAEIWPLLAKTPAGAGDEIQLTDAIAMLMQQQTVNAYAMEGKSHDCGNKQGYMRANVEYALRHAEIGAEFSQYLNALVKEL
jgi:UTP--glucose-1-phosphate uridylyltransferase